MSVENGTAYHNTLNDLSEASVHRHFDAFASIPWDDPEFEVSDDDPRWILGPEDNLGAHPWYQSLPEEEQIRIGRYRFAQICKTGLQFEQLLIAGVMYHNLDKSNGNPEFRYSMHEATEETHHIQMFQEFVNRTGEDVEGAPEWFRTLIPLVTPVVARKAPAVFWTAVLAGEEPIDHAQKDILRQGKNLHPLIQRVMQIHVAEEARHISFAHTYLEEHVPKLSPVDKLALAAITPIVMRVGADVIMRPSKKARDDMGIPDDVAREIWWDSPEGKEWLVGLFPDARMLADTIGLRDNKLPETASALAQLPSKLGRFAWKRLGIDGRPSRYRSEPVYEASALH